MAPLKRVVWDVTYACPLRCAHCYSESGRRPARVLDTAGMWEVVSAILAAGPDRVSFGGGEPLLVPWWSEAAAALEQAGVPVTVFTSGWLMDVETAVRLADCSSGVAISIDGAWPEVHDQIRGRPGSFERAMRSLEVLDRVKRQRQAAGDRAFQFGLEYTVTRTGRNGLDQFVREMAARFPTLDTIRFGGVIPEGLAQEERFEAAELLAEPMLQELLDSADALAAAAVNGVSVSVSDARSFLPGSALVEEDGGLAHLEPDGQLRACTNFEAKVGNVREEPLTALWERALAWRNDPFVVEQILSIHTLEDWARVTRVLDRQYGSAADQLRIARRK